MQGFTLLGGKALKQRLEDVSAPAGVCDRCEQSAERPTNLKKMQTAKQLLLVPIKERLISGQERAE